MAFEMTRKARSRVISHARYGLGKQVELAGSFARDDGGRTVGNANADDAEQNKNRCRSKGYWLQKSYENVAQIHRRIISLRGEGSDVTKG